MKASFEGLGFGLVVVPVPVGSVMNVVTVGVAVGVIDSFHLGGMGTLCEERVEGSGLTARKSLGREWTREA